jgi:wyosine [tRNA(Phe)-imidazoG37] synthetase (radical SAM superfamily)
LKEKQRSPKFGSVLPIDFDNKNGHTEFYPADEIFSEIKDYFTKKQSPDYIWLNGFKDISLYLGFQRLLNMIKETFPNQKIGGYINASLFVYENVRKAFLSYDLVVINLNSVVQTNFYQSCICNEDWDIEEILNGVRLFSIYTMLLKGINEKLEDVVRLKSFLLEVKPNHLSVNTFNRCGFEPVSDEFKDRVKETLQDLPFKVSFTF